jgi:cysteinyl-tRNA synthetase
VPTVEPYKKRTSHGMILGEGGVKMSKSLGNFYTLDDLIKKGIDPIAFRMWLYTSNYSTRTNFTLEAVIGAGVALVRLKEAFLAMGDIVGEVNLDYKKRFIKYLDDNLDSPRALTLVWELLKDSSISNEDKKATLLNFDNVFGFGLDKIKAEIIPDEIKKLVKDRELARQEKNWAKSDELRDKINSLGYEIKDTEGGYKVYKK